MRMKLTYNYWLMIVSWCMFLNGYDILAIIIGLFACLILSLINRKINLLRACALAVIVYNVVLLSLFNSNISYFFPSLHYLLAVICFNCALTNEYLYLFKSKYLFPYLVFMIIGLFVISIITAFLPDDLYTIFTKDSLYTMVSYIFLPYLIPITYCFIYKRLKHQKKAVALTNKEATM